MRPKFAQLKATTLDIGISATETTEIVLKRLVDVYGNEVAMTDIGSVLMLTLNPGGDNEEIISCTDFAVASNGKVTLNTTILRGLSAISPYTTGGTASPHSAGTVVVHANNPQMYEAILDYIDGVAIAGGANATESSVGFLELATEAEIDADTPSGSAGPLAITPDKLATSKYGERLPSVPGKVFLDTVTGMLFPFAGSTTPAGFLLADGSDYSVATYLDLAQVLLGKFGYGTGVDFTADNTTNIFTKTSHGLADNTPIFVANVGGGLPAGLTANTLYYVRDATTNTFKLATSVGGTAVDITTNGTGTQYFYVNFKVPDLRGSVPIGSGTKSATVTVPEASITVQAITGTTTTDGNTQVVTNSVAHGLATGDSIMWSASAPGGLSLNTLYYVIVGSTTTYQVASSFANALANVYLDLSTAGGVGGYKVGLFNTSTPLPKSLQNGVRVVVSTSNVLPTGMTAGEYVFKRISDTQFSLCRLASDTGIALVDDGTGNVIVTMTMTARTIADEGGSETHVLTVNEMPTHRHKIAQDNGTASDATLALGNLQSIDLNSTTDTGGDDPHNNMPPFVVLNWVIKT